MNIVGPRTYMEVRVGRYQSAEILLHLRRADVSWFRHNLDVLRAELLDLLQTSVLPRLLAHEVELHHAVITQTPLPPNLGPGGIPMTVGEKNNNKQKTGKEDNNNSSNNINSNKRKRGVSKKKQAELKRQREEEERERRNNEKDIYYATGDTIRIVYRTEPIGSCGATLVFQQGLDEKEVPPSDAGKKQAGVRLRALKKLSKRILVWCYPANAELPASEGFWRPEVIPVASLFRMPASEVAAANNTKNSRSNKKDKVIDLLQEDE